VRRLFFAAALNSTVNALAFILIAPFISPYGIFLAIPFLFFIKGKRFTYGMKIRKESHKNIGIESKFKWVHIINIPKVIVFYIYHHIWPSRLGFFYGGTNRKIYASALFQFFACILCLEWLWIGTQVDRLMIWWYFASLIIF
jgi:hypothetical protein